MVPPILFAHRARLHQRQKQCTKNRTSATSSRRNSTSRGAPSPGSPDSSASRAKTPTRSSTAAGSTPTCSSKSATCWTTISSNVIRITGTAGKKNDFSGFCGGVSEKVVILQAEINRGTVRRRPKFGDDLSSEPACRFLFLCFYRCYAILHLFARPLYAYHHFHKANAYQLVVHLQHIGKYLLIGDPFLRRLGLSVNYRIPKYGV